MRNSKVILGVIIALVIILSQFSIMSTATSGDSTPTGTTVSGVDSKYVVKFSSSQSNRFISCDEMSTLLGQPIANGGEYEMDNKVTGAEVAYNEDGSMSITKPIGLYGANLEIPITEQMKTEYLNNTSHILTASFYLSKSLSESKLFTDTQIRVYTRFKSSGSVEFDEETYTGYLKCTSLGRIYAKAYQPYLDTKFKLLGFDDQPLENLDNVESIIISLYQFEYTDAKLEFSGITYENHSPALKKYVAPTPGSADKSVPIIRYRREYDKKWAGHPSTVKYSAKGGFDTSAYTTTAIGSLYLKNINEVFSKQLAIYYDFDIDEFNKGILTANQEEGSKQAYLTLNVAKLKDTDGADMLAEFELQLFRFDDEVITLNRSWVKEGDTKILKFDISDIDINSISYIKLGIQNYWKYCEADGRYYDYDKKEEKDGKIYCPDNLGNKSVDVTDKVLKDRTMKNVEVFISSINTVVNGEELTTAATKATTTNSNNGDYEYAGYHFMDFKQESLDETYGNNPSNIDFLFENYYQRYSLANSTYKNNNSKGTKINGDKKYISDYDTARSLSSGGYQLQLNSGFEKVQAQYQSSYWKSGKIEDANRTSKTQDHDPLKPQGEKYDYSTQMANAIKYAKNNPDPKLKGYLAIDVNLVSAIHGYKNSHNKTYKAWCQKNNKKCVDTNSTVEFQVMIHAKDKNDVDCSAETVYEVQAGEKATLFIDVSELDPNNITNVRIVAQNYGNIANKAQGGNDATCGITNVTARFSAIYVPGMNQSKNLTTTVNVTRPFSEKDAKKIKQLYDNLPGLKVSDYETYEDYEKLFAFQKAWISASIATQEYCEKKYKIDYIKISMLEAEVYEKFMTGYGFDGSPSTGDTVFPITALLGALLAGALILKTYRKRS